MRLAFAACAIAIALVVGVFAFLVVSQATPTTPRWVQQWVHGIIAPSDTATVENPPPHPDIVANGAPADASEAPLKHWPRTIAQRTPSTQDDPQPNPVPPPAAGAPGGATPAPARSADASAAGACPVNPNALGIARTVEIDTTGGPGFGFEHFRQHDFLEPGEVVLTFDDGPWPQRTMAVLNALASHCTKAVFFPIGKHATFSPTILKAVAAAGHSVGSHTWSHPNLARKSVEDGVAEIEKGFSAVAWAVGGPIAPFFRFPQLRHPPELVSYLGERNVGIFSTDLDSFDFRTRRPEQVRNTVMAKLKKQGKGIVLMHDFQQSTARAAADLLDELKAAGYRVVHMRPKFAFTTLPAYDEEFRKNPKLPTVNQRPTSTVVKTVN